MGDRENFVQDDEDTKAYKQKVASDREILICLVDASDAMFATAVDSLADRDEAASELGPECRYIDKALVCISRLLRQRVFQAPKDSIGIIFYGTRESRTSLGEFPHLYAIGPHQGVEKRPEESTEEGAPPVSTVERITGITTLPAKFDRLIGSCGALADDTFKNALWAAHDMVKVVAGTRKGGSRKIAIFSCNPSPPGANDVAARSRAEEIKSASIDVALVKLDHRMATDNYANLLTLPIVGDTDMDPAEPYSVDDIVADLTCPDHHKRRIRQLTLCIGEQRIGMGVYALQHNAAKPKKVKIDADTQQEVKSRSVHVNQDVANVVPRERLTAKFLGLGGAGKGAPAPLQVVFAITELAELKRGKPAGFHLLGFQAISDVKDHQQLKHPLFVYPDDETWLGSTTAFCALLGAMLAQESCAVCEYRNNANAAAQLVALMPQKGDDGEPDGMHVIFLPFAEDLRHAERTAFPPHPPAASAADEEAAERFAGSVALGFEGSLLGNWANPGLAHFLSELEGIAFDNADATGEGEKIPARPFEDATEKSWQHSTARKGGAAKRFVDAVMGEDYAARVEAEGAGKGRKRKAAAEGEEGGDAEGSGKGKKAKAELTDEDFIALYKENASLDGFAKKCTADDLKAFLGRQGLKKGGKKGELAERVYEKLATMVNDD